MKKTCLLIMMFCFLCFAQAQDADLIDITSFEQLDAIRYDLDGDGSPDGGLEDAEKAAYRTAFTLSGISNNTCTNACIGYKLMNDIDASGETWQNISGPFDAVFNGKGNKILNLTVDDDSRGVGVFGILGTNGVIRNLGVVNVNVTSRRHSTFAEPAGGGLVGENEGRIVGCYVTGKVDTEFHAGGLVGKNSRGSIVACYSQVDIGGTQYNFADLGGLVGYNDKGHIRACYATGNIISPSNGPSTKGGLVGLNAGWISACYATGNVSNSGSGRKAGLVAFTGSNTTASWG